MIKVIAINGSGGSGKDTFVELCRDLGNNIFQISHADIAKDVAAYCGWKGTKTEKDRKFLSDLTDALAQWNDMPFKHIKHYINILSDNSVLFVHVREPEVINRLVREYDATTLLIKSNIDGITTNHADANVDMYEYDTIIYNDHRLGLDYLRTQAKDYMISKGLLKE